MRWQPATGLNTKQQIGFPVMTIREPGYVFVYLSYENDSDNYVQFDDLRIEHTPTNVIQYNEYYAYGLQTGNSWTRDDHSNNYLYNAGNELNPVSGWYEMFYRGYDPALGRMLQVDPYAVMYASSTTYNYGLNNPVTFNDPSGGRAVAPAGVSVSAWNRIQRLNNANDPHYTQNFVDGWHESYGGGMFDDAWSVKNGSMSLRDYARKYGASYGGGENGLVLALLHLNTGGNFQGAGSLLFGMGGAMYGGTYHTVNGLVVSAAVNRVYGSAENGWVGEAGAVTHIVEVGGEAVDAPAKDNGLPWLNVAAAEVSIWGIATTISVNGPKPKYTGPKEWANQKAAGVKFGKVLGYAGLALTAYDMYQNGLDASNSLDAFFGGVSFAGPWGAAAGGVYFVGNLISVGVTDKTIGQHVEENFYVVPAGLPNVPFILIPKN